MPTTYFVVVGATPTSDNSSRFRKNLPEKIQKLIITNDHKIRDEKLQYDINREAAKLSASSSVKGYKYKYLPDEKIIPSDERRMIEQAKFYPFL